MSLSFVSKSIQTSRDDGGFDEKPIEGLDEKGGKAATSVHKPLFEQLRDNKEQEDAEREEFQRSLMRGTLALDEEGAAHLDAIGKQKRQEQEAVQRQVQSELAAFRAAQVDRSSTTLQVPDEDEPIADTVLAPTTDAQQQSLKRSAAAALATKVVIKRKRRKDESAPEKKEEEPKEAITRSTEKSPPPPPAATGSGSLGGLLTGYGSSSEEDD